MAFDGKIRAVAGAVAAIAGLVIATSAGAPFLAALIAVTAGLIASAIALAQRPPDRGEHRPADEADAPPPLLPEVTDVIEAVGNPVLIVRERRVLIANRAARDVLGSHIEGVDVRLAIRHPAAAERLAEDIGAEASVTELTGLGEPDRRWEMAMSPLSDGSRLVRLTDRSEALASEQMRADFVANASHELRTPLSTLIGFSETLLDDPAADVKTRQRFLTIMAAEARRMQQLIDDLISLSRIEGERFSVPREPVALLPLIDEIRMGCGQLIAEKESRIVVEGGELNPIVAGDETRLLQLLRNLIINSLKYGRAGEPIVVRFEEAGPDMFRVSVVDRGDGIPAEHLPRLTERFYRVDPSRSRAVGGTGLGLAIVKHIAQRHRGRLQIQSKVGEGTIVSVFLPALSPSSNIAVTQDTPNEPSDFRDLR